MDCSYQPYFCLFYPRSSVLSEQVIYGKRDSIRNHQYHHLFGWDHSLLERCDYRKNLSTSIFHGSMVYIGLIQYICSLYVRWISCISPKPSDDLLTDFLLSRLWDKAISKNPYKLVRLSLFMTLRDSHSLLVSLRKYSQYSYSNDDYRFCCFSPCIQKMISPSLDRDNMSNPPCWCKSDIYPPRNHESKSWNYTFLGISLLCESFIFLYGIFSSLVPQMMALYFRIIFL